MHTQATPPVAMIDDDEQVCRSLGRVLRESGFCPHIFLSAQEFLASPERAHLRCLLVDIQLGGLSGIALHRQLLSQRDTTPVIYITAQAEPAVRAEALSLGCAGFVLKTDAAAEIVTVLRRVTQHP